MGNGWVKQDSALLYQWAYNRSFCVDGELCTHGRGWQSSECTKLSKEMGALSSQHIC